MTFISADLKLARLLIGSAAAATMVLGSTTAASAVEVVSVPVDGVYSGSEGATFEVASVSIPEAYIGQTCLIVGETHNQESVHPGNDLLIVAGGRTLVIPNFEDEGFIVHEAGELETMPATISVLLRLGPEHVSSGGFKVTVDCEQPVVETTVPPVEIAPETTVTAVTVPETTPAIETTETTTVDVAIAPAGPTTEPTIDDGATSTAPSSTSTTAAPSAPVEVKAATLPVTGSSTAVFAAAGMAMVAAGFALLRFGRLAVGGSR